MNAYEILLSEASGIGLTVKEKPLQWNNGRIKGNRVAIRQDLDTSTEKACVLAEELGHHHTSSGNILDQTDTNNRKQELRARMWAYNELIGLRGIINAYEHGCSSMFDMAEYLEVTEEFLSDCIENYRSKYGVSTVVDNYYIIFIPNLVVGKIIK